MPEMKRRESMRVSTVAHVLGVTTRTIRHYIEQGKLESFTLPGGQHRVFRDSLDRLMEERDTKTFTPPASEF